MHGLLNHFLALDIIFKISGFITSICRYTELRLIKIKQLGVSNGLCEHEHSAFSLRARALTKVSLASSEHFQETTST